MCLKRHAGRSSKMLMVNFSKRKASVYLLALGHFGVPAFLSFSYVKFKRAKVIEVEIFTPLIVIMTRYLINATLPLL
jgi:hypothetical protein